MRLVGRGHPAIRATHGKTLEFTRTEDITERATCVVAVGINGGDAPMAGPVQIAINTGGHSFAFTARGNSGWDPGGSAVVRRSPLRLPDTYATGATATAADLPRELVAALRDPAAQVVITVEPLPSPPSVVLFALDLSRPHDPRLAAEVAAADLVIAEDAEAARALGERVTESPVSIDGRVLVVASRDLPGRTVVDALATSRIETVGLSPQFAVAAASPSLGPIVVAPPDADPRAILGTAPADSRVVLTTSADRLPALLALAVELRGSESAVLAQRHTDPVRAPAAVIPGLLTSSEGVFVCLDASTESNALDPAVCAAVDALLADGVPTRAVAKALAALTGWDRRRAYDAVLNWRSRHEPRSQGVRE